MNASEVIDEISKQRALNNEHFMNMWKLVFNCPLCREKAKAIQQEIRKGDMRITELNKQLCE